LIPPPEPVDSTTGALNELVFPNVSATAVENGKTVEEPTIRIWSRATADPAAATETTAASAVAVSRCFIKRLR
jgi:hypothetical protein